MAPRIDWQQHIKAWQAGGLSQSAYCRLHRLGPSSFSAKLREHRALPPAAPLPVSSGLVPVRAVPADGPVPPPPGAATGGPLVLRTASGHRLELPPSCEPRWVAELLRCLG